MSFVLGHFSSYQRSIIKDLREQVLPVSKLGKLKLPSYYVASPHPYAASVVTGCLPLTDEQSEVRDPRL